MYAERSDERNTNWRLTDEIMEYVILGVTFRYCIIGVDDP